MESNWNEPIGAKIQDYKTDTARAMQAYVHLSTFLLRAQVAGDVAIAAIAAGPAKWGQSSRGSCSYSSRTRQVGPKGKLYLNTVLK